MLDDAGGFEDWSGPGWDVFDGILVSDGSDGVILAPFEPNSAGNYAIEADVELAQWVYNGGFGLTAADGYIRATPGFIPPSMVQARPYLSVGDNSEGGRDRRVSVAYTSYRIEIQDGTVTFLIGGEPIYELTDNSLRRDSGGTIGIFAEGGMQVNVYGFRVIAL